MSAITPFMERSALARLVVMAATWGGDYRTCEQLIGGHLLLGCEAEDASPVCGVCERIGVRGRHFPSNYSASPIGRNA
jgi:hypothetical protein